MLLVQTNNIMNDDFVCTHVYDDLVRTRVNDDIVSTRVNDIVRMISCE